MAVTRRVGLVIDRLHFRLGFLSSSCVHAGLHYFDLRFDFNDGFDFGPDFDLECTFDSEGAFDFVSDFIFLATDWITAFNLARLFSTLSPEVSTTPSAFS